MTFIREKGFSEKYSWEEIENLAKNIKEDCLSDDENIIN